MSRACDQISGELLARIREELPDASTREVEDHLRSCPECRRESEEIAVLGNLLMEMPGPEPAPDGFARIRQRIERDDRARRRRLPFLLLPLAAAAAAFVAFLLPSSTFPPSPSLRSLHGEVLVRNEPLPTGGRVRLESRTEIRAGTATRVAFAGRRETDVVLAPGSRLVFLEDGRFEMESGRAFFTVGDGDGDFRVRTPNGDATVTGTKFDLTVEDDRTDLAVLDGTVSFRTGAGAPVRVVSGYAVSAFAGGPPGEPQKVDPWRVRDWLSRPTLLLASSPRGLVLTLRNDNPAPIAVKPFDPSSATWSLRVRREDDRIGPPRQIRVQSVMVVHDNRTPEGPDPVILEPEQAYRLVIDPAELDLSEGRYLVSAVYKPYTDLPEEVWRGEPIVAPPVEVEQHR